MAVDASDEFGEKYAYWDPKLQRIVEVRPVVDGVRGEREMIQARRDGFQMQAAALLSKEGLGAGDAKRIVVLSELASIFDAAVQEAERAENDEG